MAKKRAILVDFAVPEKWSFHEALETTTGTKWEVIGLQSNRYHGGIRNIVRYAQYFLLPFKILLKKSKYTSIVAWQQFYGLILASYLRFFGVKAGPDVSAMTFIYKQKASWLGKLYFKFVQYALRSQFLKTVFVYSDSEVEHYSQLFGVPKTLFRSVRLGVEDERSKMEAFVKDGGYYVAAGRSNRDYGFLLDTWKNRKLRIICDTLKMEDTEFVRCLKNCHNEDYLREMAGCHAVIIPLQDENISSGQLVLLHAMMLGKPVVITKNNALQEYVIDGCTGLVIEKTEEALASALAELDVPERYCAISEKAREYFEEHFTYEQLGRNVGEVLSTE